MSVYCRREDYLPPVGAHGPVDEDDAVYFPYRHTLEPTDEQQLAAGHCDGPSLSEVNVRMVLRALGYEIGSDFYGDEFDAAELLSRCTMARVCPPVDDSGIAPVRYVEPGRMTLIDCGMRAGGMEMRYEAIAEVCEQAMAWGVPVVIC